MADEADIAANASDAWLAQAIRATREAAPTLKRTGECHFCEREFTAEEDGKDFELKLFCDKSCSDDHTKYNKRRT